MAARQDHADSCNSCEKNPLAHSDIARRGWHQHATAHSCTCQLSALLEASVMYQRVVEPGSQVSAAPLYQVHHLPGHNVCSILQDRSSFHMTLLAGRFVCTHGRSHKHAYVFHQQAVGCAQWAGPGFPISWHAFGVAGKQRFNSKEGSQLDTAAQFLADWSGEGLDRITQKEGNQFAGAHSVLDEGHDHLKHKLRLLIQDSRCAQLARLFKLPTIHQADVAVSTLHSKLLL